MAFSQSGHFYHVPAWYQAGNAVMNEEPAISERREAQTRNWAVLLPTTQFHNWVFLGQRPETWSYMIKDFLVKVISKPASLIDVGINHFFRLILYEK